MNKRVTKTELARELEIAREKIAELERSASQKDVVKLKNIENPQHKSEQIFSQVFHISPTQMAITDLSTGKYVNVNSKFLKTLGFAKDEVIGKTALELNLFVDAGQRAALLAKMRTDGFLQNENVLVRGKTGAIHHGIFSAEYIQVQDQKFLLTVMNDVTERKQAEEKLKQSEYHYRALIESLDVSLCRWKPDTTLTYTNEKYQEIFGVQGEAIGKKWLDLLPEETRNSTAMFYGTLAEEPRKVVYEHPVNVKNGSMRYFQWIDTPILDSAGEVLEFQSVGIDITELKKAEETLLESQNRLKGFLDSTPDAMVIANKEGRIILTNLQTEKLLGYSQDELLNMTVEQMIPEKLRDTHLENRARFMKNPKNLTAGTDHGFRVMHKDGTGLLVEISLSHHKMMDGEEVVLSTIRDITERKQGEDQLRKSQQILQETQNIAKIQSWVMDFQTGLFHIGPGDGKILGQPAGTYKFGDLNDLIHPSDRADVLSAWEQAAQSGTFLDIEHRVLVNRELKWVHVKTQSSLDDQNPLLISGFAQDITERKLAEELISAQRDLARLISTATTETEALPRCMEAALRVSGMDSGGIYLFDTEQQALDLVYHQGLKAEFIQEVSQFSIETSRVQMILAGMMFYFSEAELGGQEHHQNEGLRSLAVIPILDHGHVLGCINIGSHTMDQVPQIARQALETISAEIGTIISHLRTEALLRESELRAQAMLRAIPDLVVRLNRQGIFLDFKAETQNPYTPPGQSVIGRHNRDMLPKYLADLIEQKIQTTLQTGVLQTFEYQLDIPGLGMREHEARMTPSGTDEVTAVVRDITERKQVENALLASEKKLSSLIASQTHFVIRINMEGKYVYWNPQFEREFGWVHPDGLQNADCMKSICQYHHQRVIEVVQKCIARPGQVFSVEIDKPSSDNGIRTSLWDFMCLTNEYNQPSEIQCMGVEITDRKKTEEALLKSEAKYRLLAENISDIIWILDVESSRFRYVSPSVTTLRGYSVEEILNEKMVYSLTSASRKYLSQVTPERLAEFRQGILKAYTDELEQTRKDGSTVWTEVTSRYAINPDNNRLEVYGVTRDITERRKAETAIRLIEKRNTALIENAPDGIALVDANGVFIFASPSAYRMFNYSPEEIVGTQSREKVHPQDVHLLAKLREKMQETPGQPLIVEYRFLHKNGSYHWLESTYTNMFNEPSVEGIVINFRDITERKQTEEINRQQSEQIRLLYEASQQLNRTLDLKEIYQTICDFMSVIAPNDSLFISDINHETQLITCRAYWMDNKWLDVGNFPTIPLEQEGKGTQSLVIRTGKAMLINDYQSFLKNTKSVYRVDGETNEISNEDQPGDKKTRSALLAPLKSGGVVKGVIQVASYRQNAYTENQLKLLESLALHIASAEQNALLYTQLLAELNERKQVEEALRASNETAQAILNASTESVFLMDVSGKVIAANETTAVRLGKQAAEMIGANVYDLIPHSIGAARKKQIEIAFRERKPIIFEDERFGVWMENSIYPIIDSDGEIRRVAIFGRDITDRKRAENALRESEGRARAMLQTIPDLMFRLDREGIFLDYKADTHDLHEQSMPSLIGIKNRNISPVEFADLIDEQIQKTLDTGQLQTFEYQLPVPQKGLRDYEARINPSGPNEVLAIVRDITERKQVEESLRESQSRVELALKGANAGMWDWYVQTGKTVFNERWAEIIGYALEELEPVSIQTWANLCHPDDLKISDELLNKHFAGETQFYECEVRMKHKNDSWVWVFDRGKVMEWDENGKPLRMIGTHLDITEKKQAEEALRAREELYRLISTINADYVFSADVDVNGISFTKWVGGGFEAITGYTFEEYTRLGGWESILHPDDREKNAGDLAALMKNQKVISDLRMINKNGEIRWVQIHANPLWDWERQRLVGIYGAVQDITERKKAEEALRESEEKYRVLIESLDNIVASVDGEGKFLYMNDLAAEQMGNSADLLVGKTMYELFPDAIASRQMEDIKQVIKNDKSHIYEAVSIVQGKPRWYRTSILPIHDESGRVVHVLINSTDIDDIKAAQQELQELNRTLEARVTQRTAEVQDLYDNAPTGYHSIDTDGKILMVNQTELNWLGYTRDELTGCPIQNLMTEQSREIFRNKFPTFKSVGWMNEIEIDFIRKDGSILPTSLSATAIRDEAGNFLMSRSTLSNITERKKAELTLRESRDELRYAYAALEKASHAKDDFLANMSHELRTPLNGILGISEILLSSIRGSLNEHQAKLVQVIDSSGHHLLGLINDILDLSKIEAGKLEIQPEKIIITDVCRASLAFVKEISLKKGVALEFKPNLAVPTMMADPRRLKQILVNLLSNAVKFTSSGGRVTLEVIANLEKGLIEYSVIDSGIGISHEDLQKLFTPFVQVDSSLSRQFEGTGLGLALVKTLTELHGGSVVVDSTVGLGSRFTVSLPWQYTLATQEVFKESDRIIQTQTTENIHQPGLTHASSATILLAEDAETNIMVISGYLESFGYRVIVARNGQEAIERAEEHNPDIILMDIQMPVLNGLEAMQRLRRMAHFQITPIVALTALAMVGDRERCLAAGANEYLSKPVNLKNLAKVVKELLQKDQALNQNQTEL